MKFLLLLVILFVSQYTGMANSINTSSDTLSLYKIKRIKKRDGYYVIYASRNDSLFKIISIENGKHSCQSNNIQKGKQYYMQLSRIYPIDSIFGMQIIYGGCSDVTNIGIINGQTETIERKYHYSIYNAENLNGLEICYNKMLCKNAFSETYDWSKGIFITFPDTTVQDASNPGKNYTVANTNRPQYHYFFCDHLGSVRVVTDAQGNIEQINHYYPYGGLMGESKDFALNQPYKYNGKELDRKNGLDTYDYGARFYDGNTWRNVDQLAEKYYDVSPFVYCMGNPLRFIDPDGRFIGDYYSLNGKYLGSDRVDDGNKYVVTEKDDLKKFKSSNGLVNNEDIPSAYLLPPTPILNKAQEILSLEISNSGQSEHGVLVMSDGTFVHSSESFIDGGIASTIVALPSGYSASDIIATIHSHLTGSVNEEGLLDNVGNAKNVGIHDNTAFKGIKTNIIVGYLGFVSSSVDTFNANKVTITRPPYGYVFYNSQAAFQFSLTQKALNQILNFP